jgi:hypothetical protein
MQSTNKPDDKRSDDMAALQEVYNQYISRIKKAGFDLSKSYDRGYELRRVV